MCSCGSFRTPCQLFHSDWWCHLSWPYGPPTPFASSFKRVYTHLPRLFKTIDLTDLRAPHRTLIRRQTRGNWLYLLIAASFFLSYSPPSSRIHSQILLTLTAIIMPLWRCCIFSTIPYPPLPSSSSTVKSVAAISISSDSFVNLNQINLRWLWMWFSDCHCDWYHYQIVSRNPFRWRHAYHPNWYGLLDKTSVFQIHRRRLDGRRHLDLHLRAREFTLTTCNAMTWELLFQLHTTTLNIFHLPFCSMM